MKGFLLVLVLIVGLSALAYFAGNPPDFGGGSSAFKDASSTGDGQPLLPDKAPTTAPKASAAPKPKPKTPWYLLPSRSGTNTSAPSVSPTPKTSRLVNPPEGYSAQQLSPHFHKVSMRVYPRAYGNASPVVRLTARLTSSDPPVNITGWMIKASRDWLTIPTAASVIYPGNIGAADMIRLGRGQYAQIYLTGSGSYNPIGFSFRLNRCTGYLNYYGFRPQLPKTCPRAVQNTYSGFSSACQSYIRTLSTCESPGALPLNIQLDYPCRNYLEQFENYSACYNANHNMPDFFSNEWRIYINRSGVFEADNDKVELLDGSGLLVNVYSY